MFPSTTLKATDHGVNLHVTGSQEWVKKCQEFATCRWMYQLNFATKAATKEHLPELSID